MNKHLTVNLTKMTENTINPQSFTISNTKCCTNSAISTMDGLENLQFPFRFFYKDKPSWMKLIERRT